MHRARVLLPQALVAVVPAGCALRDLPRRQELPWPGTEVSQPNRCALALGDSRAYAVVMTGPSTEVRGSADRPVVVPHPDDEADVRAGLDEAERGEGAGLTPEELEHWAQTGELRCLDSSSSRPGT